MLRNWAKRLKSRKLSPYRQQSVYSILCSVYAYYMCVDKCIVLFVCVCVCVSMSVCVCVCTRFVVHMAFGVSTFVCVCPAEKHLQVCCDVCWCELPLVSVLACAWSSLSLKRSYCAWGGRQRRWWQLHRRRQHGEVRRGAARYSTAPHKHSPLHVWGGRTCILMPLVSNTVLPRSMRNRIRRLHHSVSEGKLDGGRERERSVGGGRERERETPNIFWSGCADGGDEVLVWGQKTC